MYFIYFLILKHPNALEFLRKDLANVRHFFSRAGIVVPSVRQLFYFVVCDLDSIVASDDKLDKQRDITDAKYCLQTHASNSALDTILDGYTDAFIASAICQDESDDVDVKAAREMDDHVFANTFIPRTLDDVSFVERKLFGGDKVEGEDLVYKNVAGIQDMNLEDEESSSESEDEEDDDVYINSDEFDDCGRTLKKDEDKEDKKVCFTGTED